MKKLLTFPIRAMWQSFIVPVKVLLSSVGFIFRAGFTVGSLPVRGGALVSRALGWKILGALTLGVVIGVIIGRRLAAHDHAHHGDDVDVAPPVSDSGAAA